MNEILNDVKKNYCSVCFVGTPFKMLNYDSSGTCMDYIYDQEHVPFSFAWEVYTNEIKFPEMEQYIKKQKNAIVAGAAGAGEAPGAASAARTAARVAKVKTAASTSSTSFIESKYESEIEHNKEEFAKIDVYKIIYLL